jgi:cell division protein FtsW (lipid II flippase)
MKFFEASIGTIVSRFFLLVAIVIIAGFSGQWWISVFALPILLSAMTGVSFRSSKRKKVAKHSALDHTNKSEAA